MIHGVVFVPSKVYSYDPDNFLLVYMKLHPNIIDLGPGIIVPG